jgi:hypothetical protein
MTSMYHGGIPGGGLDLPFLCFTEPGGTDHHSATRLPANFKIRERRCGASKVDQHIKVIHYRCQVRAD